MFKKNGGFTLIEILLVVAAIAILAGIVILAINPAKQLGDTRNAQRWSDVNTILNAVYQYSIDNDSLPGAIPTSVTEICATGVGTCGSLIDLSVLTNSKKYLVSMPIEPQKTSSLGIGYTIVKDAYNRITVAAPHAEQDVIISATR